ncbi:MAG TPA: DNA polymerase III subunit epsilon [Moraxellaceae bacterium]|nr:DNA polymerase III subunit epsilon [Moraxellaceae bacterium]
MNRQIILDTETTGIDPGQGHRLIEIGCLELVNRRLTGRSFHYYVNPGREIEAEAIAVHGITNEFLVDKPVFSAIVDEFIAFVSGAELVIHNAPFDIGFINHELRLLNRNYPPITELCGVLDTLPLARSKHPGQKNNLDALARRYGANNRDRTYHGALLDAEILADVFLAMTGGQVGLALGSEESGPGTGARSEGLRRLDAGRPPLPVIRANEEECRRHDERLAILDKAAGGTCLWRRLEAS